MITDNHIMHAEVFNHIPNQQFSQAKNGKIPLCFNGPAAQRSSKCRQHSCLNEPSEGPLCLDTEDSHLQDNGLWKA